MDGHLPNVPSFGRGPSWIVHTFLEPAQTWFYEIAFVHMLVLVHVFVLSEGINNQWCNVM